MNKTNIGNATEWFEVLQTTERSQTAMMTLLAGKSTGEKAEAHKTSDQVLLLLGGRLSGEIDGKRTSLRRGDIVVISAGAKHRFTNKGSTPAVTFNVYSPPAYPRGTKGRLDRRQR